MLPCYKVDRSAADLVIPENKNIAIRIVEHENRGEKINFYYSAILKAHQNIYEVNKRYVNTSITMRVKMQV